MLNQREREIQNGLSQCDCVGGEILIAEADVEYLLKAVGELRHLSLRMLTLLRVLWFNFIPSVYRVEWLELEKLLQGELAGCPEYDRIAHDFIRPKTELEGGKPTSSQRLEDLRQSQLWLDNAGLGAAVREAVRWAVEGGDTLREIARFCGRECISTGERGQDILDTIADALEKEAQ